MAIKTCKECGKEVSTKAEKCPSCGAPVPTAARTTWTIMRWSIYAIITFIVGSCAYVMGTAMNEADQKADAEKVN